MRWVGKTRSVRIATHDGDRVYHSIEDVPPELRQIVMQTLEGPNSETVLIANQEAYERLNQQFRELPNGLEEVTDKPDPDANRRQARIWAWAVAGSLLSVGSLWLAWVFLIQNGTS